MVGMPDITGLESLEENGWRLVSSRKYASLVWHARSRGQRIEGEPLPN